MSIIRNRIEENIQKDLQEVERYLIYIWYKYNEYIHDFGFIPFDQYYINCYYSHDLNEDNILLSSFIDRIQMNISYDPVQFQEYENQLINMIQTIF